MKKLMMFGALVGFALGLSSGVVQKAPWPEALWRASIVCFVSSYLFRWWGRAWLRSLREAQLEQRARLSQAPPA